MNCDRNPYADDDPFLPAQDAPTGQCAECGHQHRLDLGCPHAEMLREARAGKRVVALLVALFLGAIVAGCWGISR